MKKAPFCLRSFLLLQIRVKRKLLKEMLVATLYERYACPIDFNWMIDILELIDDHYFDLITVSRFTLPKFAVNLHPSDELYQRAQASLKILKRKKMAKLNDDQLLKVHEALLVVTKGIYNWSCKVKMSKPSVVKEVAEALYQMLGAVN